MAQCTAKSKQSGKQCKRHAAPNQDKCAMHGAKTPNALAAAETRRVMGEAEAWLLEHIKDARPMGSMREVYDELLAVAGTARVMRLVMEQRVSELSTTGYQGVTGEQVKADVVLLERALDRSAKVMDLIARLNVDERRVRLAETQGALVADVIRRILDRLSLSDEQVALVGTVVPEELRALAGGDQ